MTEAIPTTQLGEQGEACRECGAPLATDQRYCLNCGRRRGQVALPFAAGSSMNGALSPNGAVAAADAGREASPLAAVAGIAILGALLMLGILIGRGSSDEVTTTPVVAGTAAPTSTGGTTAAAGEVKSEWPAGTDGYTVELGTLPKDGTTAADVDALKADLTSKGASDVGVLDSDLYGSLPGGSYILFSGVFDSKGDAQKALDGLKKDFPDAQVIQVAEKSAGGSLASGSGGSTESSGSVDDVSGLSGEDYQNAIKNDTIPDEISTEGQHAKPDNKDPGGGGDSLVIK